jgi:FkbM family methyltransferase
MIKSTVQLLGRSYPLLTGCGRLANHPVMSTIIDRIAGSEVHGELSNGSHFYGRNADFVSRAAFLFGDLDPKLTHIAKVILRRGDCVLDIGANIGVFALQTAQFVGSEGRVVAFEPQPGLANLLEKSAHRNEFENLEVHRVALGDRSTEGILCVPEGNSGSGSLVNRYEESEELAVTIEKGDPYLSSLGLNEVRLIKMDVEGFETRILRGMKDFIARVKPHAFLIESTADTDEGSESLTTLLDNFGYETRDILRSAFRVRFGQQGQSGKQAQSYDILAVRRDEIGQQLLRDLGIRR